MVWFAEVGSWYNQDAHHWRWALDIDVHPELLCSKQTGCACDNMVDLRNHAEGIEGETE